MVKRIYNNPEVYYGKGAASACLKSLDVSSMIMLVSQTVKDTEYFGKILANLAEKQPAVETIGSPSWEAIAELAAKLSSAEKPELIIAIGGGKILDSAKVLKVMLDNPGVTLEDLKTNQFCDVATTKLIAIPTTPGTGSETNSIAVVRDADNHKVPLINSGFVPDLAILDHEFMANLDAQAIYEFSADIFAHAFEGSVSAAGTPLLAAIARSAMSLLKTGFEKLRVDSKDPKAHESILHAGHLAGIVQGNAFVGACHALAHAIEEQKLVSHGQSILLCLKQTIAWLKDTTQKPEYDEFMADYETLRFDEFKKPEALEGIDPGAWADVALLDPSITTSPIRMKKDNLLVLIDWILNRQ